MTQPNRQLLPPPRLRPNDELPPVIEPPLRELAASRPRGAVEEWEHFESAPLEHPLTEELVRKAHETVMADERVKELLAGKRFLAFGAGLRDADDEKRGATYLRFMIYNYTDAMPIAINVDSTGQRVIGITLPTAARPACPCPSGIVELEQAIALARRDQRLTSDQLAGLEATAILVVPSNRNDPNFRHRQFDIRFGYPNERLPRFMALVDLNTETVLRAGAGYPGDLQNAGGSR